MGMNIYNRDNAITAERRRLDASALSEQNKKDIVAFQAYLLANNISAFRVARFSMNLRQQALILNKDYRTATKQDIQGLVAIVNQFTNLAPSTKSTYKQILKQFYKWLKGDGEEFPHEVKWIKCGVKRRERQFEEMLHPEEVHNVIFCCEDIRDKALISFLYESGARIGEVLNMKIKDFKLEDRYAKIRLYGKTGERWIIVVTSVPLLCKYMESHPYKSDINSQFWLSFGSCNHHKKLIYVGASKAIKRAFRKAGIKKRCNPHIFRHSRATYLAKSLTEVQLSLYFGWVLGTKQIGTYVHASGREVDSAILSLNGINLSDSKEKKMVNCVRCGTRQETGGFCSHCGYALSSEIAIQAEEKMKTEMDKTMDFLMEMAKNPELMKKFEEYRQKNTALEG